MNQNVRMNIMSLTRLKLDFKFSFKKLTSEVHVLWKNVYFSCSEHMAHHTICTLPWNLHVTSSHNLSDNKLVHYIFDYVHLTHICTSDTTTSQGRPGLMEVGVDWFTKFSQHSFTLFDPSQSQTPLTHSPLSSRLKFKFLGLHLQGSVMHWNTDRK